jgi:GGDEF domain-containing protein
MSEIRDGFKLLARLRGLERQLRHLRDDWRSFCDQPSPQALSDVRLRSRRFSEALEQLCISLEQPGESAALEVTEGGSAKVSRDRPAPRDVVTASRDLDAKIWEAARRWKSVLDSEEAENLESLVSVLESSADRSATLIVALGGSVASRPTGDATPDIERGNPEVTIEGLASELEGMLWRLQVDWNQVRRAPSADRVRLLHESFRVAAETAAGLRELRGTVGESRFRRSLRVGRQLTDGVHFLPYRDPFTGVYNREGFDELAEGELKRCRRYGRRFGLLILEVLPPDLAGLQRVVATARAELREYDLIARYVDDLILIGVPEGGPGATRRVASRVLKALRAENMGPWFRRLAYATLPEDGSTLGGLIEEARARLQA